MKLKHVNAGVVAVFALFQQFSIDSDISQFPPYLNAGGVYMGDPPRVASYLIQKHYIY
jgi:hypothetical protein